jgi:hypothetical protein
MTQQEINEKIDKQSPTGYKLNNIIPFSYPVRRLQMEFLVDKQPDGSLVKIYCVILKAIAQGFSSQEVLFDFLGLGETDEFMLRELYFLKEKGYINLFANKWLLTEVGQVFLDNNSVLREEAVEKYDFLIDGISGAVLSTQEFFPKREPLDLLIKDELKLEPKSQHLIEGKFHAIADVYKKESAGKSYLISYTKGEIEREYQEWLNFYLIEYVHESDRGVEPKIEIREHAESLKENKALTEKFNAQYKNFYHLLSVKSLQRNIPISDV